MTTRANIREVDTTLAEFERMVALTDHEIAQTTDPAKLAVLCALREAGDNVARALRHFDLVFASACDLVRQTGEPLCSPATKQ